MKVNLNAATSFEIKKWGPLVLMDNESMSGVFLVLPWPFSGVQIQILKLKEDFNSDKEVDVEL